ncbi:MAG: phosphoesterase PA-phosphatase related [Frankiales bacterium]|nr:phosphoesterase PA-phosphatase related [Frankiales bacterium]
MPPASSATRVTDDRQAVGLRRFGARMLLTVGGLGLAAVPFTILGATVHTQGTTANRLDLSVARHLHTFVAAHPRLGNFLVEISTVFHPNVFRAVLVLTAVALARRAGRLALWIVVTVASEALLDVLLKKAFDRARPTFADPLVHASGGSFPSGHAFGSFVGCTVAVLIVLPLLGRKARAAAIAVATAIVLLVGFSRIGLGAHYITDVLGGWLAGAALVAVSAAAFQSWREDVGLRRAHVTTEGLEPELPAEASTPRKDQADSATASPG